MAPEGKYFIIGAALIALCGGLVALQWRELAALYIATLGCLPLLFTLVFFRDPMRQAPQQANAVISPADGKIIEIAKNRKDSRFSSGSVKVSIFMSPLNVHVNRIPCAGMVSALSYHPGKFLTAFHEKASLENEQQAIEITTPWGAVGCVQIAGWVARRIVCYLKLGQEVRAGERFGMIRFGSRVDLFLPQACQLVVHPQQKVRAGRTIIGVFDEKI